jgi:Zn-dependent protease
VALSIIHETLISAREVEAELQALTSPRKSAARNLLSLGASLLLFVLFLSVNTGLSGILILIVVLLIHELGHLVSMKLLGYRDVQMFFIPFFGAAVSGFETNPSGTRRAIVSLLGPAPGIAIGIACAVLFHSTGREFFMHSARVFLLLNTFNLLPVVPLDGGRYLEAVLFSRSPMLRALSDSVAGLALALIAFTTRSVLFGIIAFFVLRSVRLTYFSSKLAGQIKQELAEQEAGEPGSAEPRAVHDRIPSHYIERLIPLVEHRLPEQSRTPKGIAASLWSVWNMVWFRPPSMVSSMFLLLLYLACLGTGIVATIGAEVSFRPRQAAEASSIPVPGSERPGRLDSPSAPESVLSHTDWTRRALVHDCAAGQSEALGRRG